MKKLIRDEMYTNTFLPEGEEGSGGTSDGYTKDEVNGLLADKADKTSLDGKADKTSLDGKADKTEVNAKADKTYVDTKLGDKADKNTMTTELGKKADTTAMNTALGNKADKSALNNYYLKTEVDSKIKALEDRIVALENK